jgi:hypothetical protein
MISVRSKMSPGALTTKLRQLQRRFTKVSPMLLIDAVRPTVHGEVLLTSLDFPNYFVDMAHPEDYVVSERRMDPYLIENIVPHHHILLLRVSLEARPGTFAVMTFVLDTGASSAVYFGRCAMQLTHEVGRLREDDLGVVYLDTPLGRCAVLETPTSRQTSSAFTLLKKLKLQLGLLPVLGTNVPIWRQ